MFSSDCVNMSSPFFSLFYVENKNIYATEAEKKHWKYLERDIILLSGIGHKTATARFLG